MNKGELIDAVAEKASVTKKQADAVLSAALEAIMEAVSDGDKVTWSVLARLSRGNVRLVRGAIPKLATRWKSRQLKFLRFRRVSCLKTELHLLKIPNNWRTEP
jgi:nucleoid DNA-binding protein